MSISWTTDTYKPVKSATRWNGHTVAEAEGGFRQSLIDTSGSFGSVVQTRTWTLFLALQPAVDGTEANGKTCGYVLGCAGTGVYWRLVFTRKWHATYQWYNRIRIYTAADNEYVDDHATWASDRQENSNDNRDAKQYVCLRSNGPSGAIDLYINHMQNSGAFNTINSAMGSVTLDGDTAMMNLLANNNGGWRGKVGGWSLFDRALADAEVAKILAWYRGHFGADVVGLP